MARFDFTTGLPSGFSITSSPAGYALNSGNTYTSFALNAGRRTDLGIMAEPASLNVLPQSDNYYTVTSTTFVSGQWTKAGASITDNGAVADPAGGTRARRLAYNNAGAGGWFVTPVISNHSTSITQSIYYKNVSGSTLQIIIGTDNAGANPIYAFVNTSTNAINYDTTGGSITATATAIGGGWYRFAATYIAPNNYNGCIVYLLGTGTVDLWVAQLEDGTTASSPIITTSGTVTRGADAIAWTIPNDGTNTLTYTFSDNTTQAVNVTANTAYNIPTTLTRTQIKYIDTSIAAGSTASISVNGLVFNEGDTLTCTIAVTNGIAGQTLTHYLTNQYQGAFTTATLLAAIQASGLPAGVTVAAADDHTVTFTLATGTYNIVYNRTFGTQIGGTGDAASWQAGNQRQIDFWIQGGASNPIGAISKNLESRWVTYTAAASTGYGLPALTGTIPNAVPPYVKFAPGINIASGEFGTGGYNYVYPGNDRLQYFIQTCGFKLIRVPFIFENMFNTNVTPFTFKTGNYGRDIDVLASVVDTCRTYGAICLLDMHNYGRAPNGLIGRDAGAKEQFALMWRMIAGVMKDKPNVAFGLSNEPNAQTATEWLQGVNLALAHIRDAGAGQEVFIMGSYWGGMHSWMSNDNNTVMLGIVDPINNYVIEAHQYFDISTGYGGYDYNDASLTPTAMGTVVGGFTTWGNTNSKTLFCGEFGVQDTSAGRSKLNELLAHMHANKSRYRGYAYWAAGQYWASYPYLAEPRPFPTGTSPGQLTMLRTYTPDFVAAVTAFTGNMQAFEGPDKAAITGTTVTVGQMVTTEAPDVFAATAVLSVALKMDLFEQPDIMTAGGILGTPPEFAGTTGALEAPDIASIFGQLSAPGFKQSRQRISRTFRPHR